MANSWPFSVLQVWTSQDLIQWLLQNFIHGLIQLHMQLSLKPVLQVFKLHAFFVKICTSVVWVICESYVRLHTLDGPFWLVETPQQKAQEIVTMMPCRKRSPVAQRGSRRSHPVSWYKLPKGKLWRGALLTFFNSICYGCLPEKTLDFDLHKVLCLNLMSMFVILLRFATSQRAFGWLCI